MAQNPLLQVAGGQPDDDELAALTAVVLTAAATSQAPRVASHHPATRSRWAGRSAMMRRSPHPGPDAWRASAQRQ